MLALGNLCPSTGRRPVLVLVNVPVNMPVNMLVLVNVPVNMHVLVPVNMPVNMPVPVNVLADEITRRHWNETIFPNG